jgi:hypothetical protein
MTDSNDQPTIKGKLDRVTGKPATIYTPPEDLVEPHHVLVETTTVEDRPERSILSSRVDAAAGAARVARYAEVIDVVACQQVPSCGQIHRGVSSAMARAVMAVADEEQAELVRDMDLNWRRWRAAEARHDALVADLRGLLDTCDDGCFRAVLDKHAGEQP